MRDVISFVLANVEIPLFIVAMFTTIAKLQRAAARHEIVTFAYTFWGEVLFYCVGLGLIYVWYFHAFLASFTAPLIGWQPSPFEWELAWAQLGLALVAVLSLWRGYETRLAATLMFAVFSFGAAAQHIHFMTVAHDYAPGNAGLILWFGDLALPLLLLLLTVFARDAYERSMGRSRV
jgi:hypothetical protein